jgi:hypothetical protein
MKYTTHFELHSQTTRLVERASHEHRLAVVDGALTLCGVLFQGTWTTAVLEASSANYNSGTKGARFQI